MSKSAHHDDYKILTLNSLAESIRPGCKFPDLWMNWPPDVFALTSLIMQRTGCYRICLIDSWWENSDRSKNIKREGLNWITEIGIYLEEENQIPFDQIKKSSKFPLLQSILSEIEKFQNKDLYILRTLTSDPVENFPDNFIPRANEARELAKLLIELHAIADSACCSFGLIDTSPNPHTKLAQCLANLLLTSTGSLSTVDKIHGIVLPKMRTPQQGIMLRSVSHHLTFHVTEAEIVWRTIPWINGHQKTINVLAIPSPYKVHRKDFIPMPEMYHSVQYFTPRIEEGLNQDRIIHFGDVVRKIIEMRKRIGRVHILIFPEMALSKAEYNFLLFLLYEERSQIGYLPVVIAGVMSKTEWKQKDKPQEEDIIPHNEVKIANFFAGRWYDVSQRKHHRWRLDRSQIMQYELSSRLPTDRYWFEYISISQRRLTVLAPNGWLALTALICEDLSRLEPVSELIRGIGPTFLTALLSDGPQLPNRWSARYASVFAEDPGTAVLSLTSLGMTKRAKQLPQDIHEDDEEPQKYVVGLWRDMFQGPIKLSVPSPGDNLALLLALSAQFQKEYTLDGRSDEETASAFKLDGYHASRLRTQTGKKIRPDCESTNIENNDIEHKALKKLQKLDSSEQIGLETFADFYGNWNDIRELSTLIFALDCTIETQGRFRNIVLNWLKTGQYNKNCTSGVFPLLYKFMYKSLKSPIQSGQGTRNIDEKYPTDEITKATEAALSIFEASDIDADPCGEPTIKYYERLTNESINYFNNIKSEFNSISKNEKLLEIEHNKLSEKEKKEFKSRRIIQAVPIAFLISIDSKLANWQLPKFKDKPTNKQIRNIRKNIDVFLQKNYNSVDLYGDIFDDQTKT